jgi:DNA-binding Lrp family transcriptional regulator
METAFILIDVERGKIPDVINELGKIDHVTEVYSITGEHDIIVKARFTDLKSVSGLVLKRIQDIKGIGRTETLLAFETHKYIDFDLAAGHKI